MFVSEYGNESQPIVKNINVLVEFPGLNTDLWDRHNISQSPQQILCHADISAAHMETPAEDHTITTILYTFGPDDRTTCDRVAAYWKTRADENGTTALLELRRWFGGRVYHKFGTASLEEKKDIYSWFFTALLGLYPHESAFLFRLRAAENVSADCLMAEDMLICPIFGSASTN